MLVVIHMKASSPSLGFISRVKLEEGGGGRAAGIQIQLEYVGVREEEQGREGLLPHSQFCFSPGSAAKVKERESVNARERGLIAYVFMLIVHFAS